jgi:hypothetical protein
MPLDHVPQAPVELVGVAKCHRAVIDILSQPRIYRPLLGFTDAARLNPARNRGSWQHFLYNLRGRWRLGRLYYASPRHIAGNTSALRLSKCLRYELLRIWSGTGAAFGRQH